MEIFEDNTSVRIIRADKNGMRLEVTKKGTVKTRFYSGSHFGTSISLVDVTGKSKWRGKFMQIAAEDGERLWGHAGGKTGRAGADGFSDIEGKGIIWTKSARLSDWNGAKFAVVGRINMSKGTTHVFVRFGKRKDS